MSIRALRTLRAIATHGTFARAGQAVGLTQSAVSLQVRTLEKEFGVSLFDRSRRRPVLTEAGKIVLEKAKEVLTLYDQITDALSDEQSLAGRLRVGAIQTALAGILPDALEILNMLHPKLRVHVSAGMSASLANQVASGELDAAVTTEPVRPYSADLNWTKLYQDPFWLISPKGQEGRGIQQILADLPLIRFDSQAWAGRMIEQELRRLELKVQDEMVLDDQDVILKMVEKGLGVAIIPLSRSRAEGLNLGRIPFGEPQLIRRVVLLEHRDGKNIRQTDALSHAITQAIAKPR